MLEVVFGIGLIIIIGLTFLWIGAQPEGFGDTRSTAKRYLISSLGILFMVIFIWFCIKITEYHPSQCIEGYEMECGTNIWP